MASTSHRKIIEALQKSGTGDASGAALESGILEGEDGEALAAVSDAEFFSSQEYQSFLQDLSEHVVSEYGPPLKVFVTADPDNAELAYTDLRSNAVYINACNSVTWGLPTRLLRSISLEGLNAHETGHHLFTDKETWDRFYKSLGKGIFWPELPEDLNPVLRKYQKELSRMILGKDLGARNIVLEVAHRVANALEDGYVDTRYAAMDPGMPGKGIALNNNRIVKQLPTVADSLKEGDLTFAIVVNEVVRFANGGKLDLGEAPSPFREILMDVLKTAGKYMLSVRAEDRCTATSLILLKMWPLLQQGIAQIRTLAALFQIPQGKERIPPEAAEAAVQGILRQQEAIRRPNQGGRESSAPRPAPPENSKEWQTIDTLRQAVGDGELAEEEKEPETGNQTSTANVTGAGAGAGAGAKAGTRTGTGPEPANAKAKRPGWIRPEKVLPMPQEKKNAENRQVPKEILEGMRSLQRLQIQAGLISYGPIHQGMEMQLHRRREIPPDLIRQYKEVSPPILRLSARLQGSVRRVQEENQQQLGIGRGRESLGYGSPADYRDFVRRNLHTAGERRSAAPVRKLAVGLVVDESGSMFNGDRIPQSRATALLVYDFCTSLSVPVLIMGHSAAGNRVDVYSYSEPDQVDPKDRYRIMEMTPRRCNRDGMVLRLAAEKLCRCPAEDRLLLVITDGQPNSIGYTGTPAVEDVKGIVQEYQAKGLTIRAAAIGEDREQIHMMYGKNCLDITDLSTMPQTIARLLLSTFLQTPEPQF